MPIHGEKFHGLAKNFYLAAASDRGFPSPYLLAH
jgi:hypothetical protein